MKKLTLLFLITVFTFGCSENVEDVELTDQQSLIDQGFDGDLIPTRPKDPNSGGTVFVQIQNLNVPFGQQIEMVYTAAGVPKINLYLERERIRQYPVSTGLFFNGVQRTQKIFIRSLQFTDDVNSGNILLNQPANAYYDDNYVIRAYRDSDNKLLATSNKFTIGNHGLTITPVSSSKKYYENSPGGLITYNSNMDPYTLMVIEINRPNEKIKRFLTNAIPSDFQVYGMSNRINWSNYRLVGKLSDLNASDVNDVLYPPPTNTFSHKDYIIKIYPYGYSGISAQISNVEFVENKTEWNTPQTPYLTKKTYNQATNNLFVDSRYDNNHHYGKLRYDLYLNGKFYKVLSGPTVNGYNLHLPLLKWYNSSPYATWRIKATWVGSSGFMTSTSSMIYINPSWLN